MNNPIRFGFSESLKRAEDQILDTVMQACTANDMIWNWRILSRNDPVGLKVQLEIFPDPMLPYAQLLFRRTYHWLCPLFQLPLDLPGWEFTHQGRSLRFWGANLTTIKEIPDGFFVHANPATGEIFRANINWVRENVLGPAPIPRPPMRLSVGLLAQEKTAAAVPANP